MRGLVATIALAACYSPQLPTCSVTCGSTSPCPDELACGSDHFCHAGDDDSSCRAMLSVTFDGGGDGTVTSSPSGVECNSDISGPACSAIPFTIGTSIMLSEMPDNGDQFGHWSGDACDGSTHSTCTFTIETTMSVNATFH